MWFNLNNAVTQIIPLLRATIATRYYHYALHQYFCRYCLKTSTSENWIACDRNNRGTLAVSPAVSPARPRSFTTSRRHGPMLQTELPEDSTTVTRRQHSEDQRRSVRHRGAAVRSVPHSIVTQRES
jgi:hypothetical protein